MDGRRAKVVRACLLGLFVFPFLVFLFSGVVGERGTVLGLDLGQVPGGGGGGCVYPFIATYCCSLLLDLSLTLLLLLSVSRLPPSPSLSPRLDLSPLPTLVFSFSRMAAGQGEREGKEGKGMEGIGLPQGWTRTGPGPEIHTTPLCVCFEGEREKLMRIFLFQRFFACLPACLVMRCLSVCLGWGKGYSGDGWGIIDMTRGTTNGSAVVLFILVGALAIN